MMKESLLTDERKIDNSVDNSLDNNQNNVNIRNINYSVLFLILLAMAYSYLFITMAMNTSSMNNNLNKIIDVMNMIDLSNLNTTAVDSIHNNFSLITECVLHKYCKRVPS
jgi:hypothetical protein